MLRIGGREFPVEIQESLREAFVQGTWDTLTELLKHTDQVGAVSAKLPYLNGF